MLLLLAAEDQKKEREREREREMCDLIKNFRVDPHGDLQSARRTIDDELRFTGNKKDRRRLIRWVPSVSLDSYIPRNEIIRRG
jgi:hypothetical protein